MPSAAALFAAAPPVSAGSPAGAPGVQGEVALDAGLFSGKIAAILGAQAAADGGDVPAKGVDPAAMTTPWPSLAVAASDQKPVRLGAVRFLAEAAEPQIDAAPDDQPTPNAADLADVAPSSEDAAPDGDAPPVQVEAPTAPAVAPVAVPTPTVARTEPAAASSSNKTSINGDGAMLETVTAPASVDAMAKAEPAPSQALPVGASDSTAPARLDHAQAKHSDAGDEAAQAEAPPKPAPAPPEIAKTDAAPSARTPSAGPVSEPIQAAVSASSPPPAPPSGGAASQVKPADVAVASPSVRDEAPAATGAQPASSKAEAAPVAPAVKAVEALTVRVQPALTTDAEERAATPQATAATDKNAVAASPTAPVVVSPASTVAQAGAIPAVLAAVEDSEPVDADVIDSGMDDADVPAPAPARSSHETRPVERPVNRDDDRHADRVALTDKAQTDAASDKPSPVPAPDAQAAKPIDAPPAAASQPPAPADAAALEPQSPAQQVAHASADRGPGLSSLSRATVETTAHLAVQMARKLEGRSTRFDMVLTPEDLGRVDVSIEIDADGQLAARLAFDNPAAAADLRGRADELRRQLQDAGFQVSGDSLDFTQRDPSSGGGFDRQQQRNALFAGGSRLAAQADAVLVPAPGAWINHSVTPERVDLKV